MKATRSRTRAAKMADTSPVTVPVAKPVTKPASKPATKSDNELKSKSHPKPEAVSEPKPVMKTNKKARVTPQKRLDTNPTEVNEKHRPNPEVERCLRLKEEIAAVRRELDVYGPDKMKKFQKDWNVVIKQSIRNCEEMESKRNSAKPSRTRSGLKRGFKPRQDYTEGRLIAKGMDEAFDKFDQDELDWLANDIKKFKSVETLTYDHVRYLICYIFLDELKAIQRGEIESYFHNTFQELDAKEELLSEVKLTLFTNEQRDYINGLLQSLFEANVADQNGDVKHNDIKYAGIVMLAESTMRIVKFIHGFKSLDETYAFMKKQSREAYGISDDEED